MKCVALRCAPPRHPAPPVAVRHHHIDEEDAVGTVGTQSDSVRPLLVRRSTRSTQVGYWTLCPAHGVAARNDRVPHAIRLVLRSSTPWLAAFGVPDWKDRGVRWRRAKGHSR